MILVAVVALPGLADAGRRLLAGPAASTTRCCSCPWPGGAARGARADLRPPPLHRGAARRGDRLRRRRAVHRRRCPGSGARAVPRRDAVAGRVRLRPAPDARAGSPRSRRGAGPGAQGRRRGGRGRRSSPGRRWCSAAPAQVPATTSAEFVRLAPEGAGATNVVSAIIVDFRALDTVGEITVLFVAAVGVASLVLDASPATAGARRAGARPGRRPGQEEDVRSPAATAGHGRRTARCGQRRCTAGCRRWGRP